MWLSGALAVAVAVAAISAADRRSSMILGPSGNEAWVAVRQQWAWGGAAGGAAGSATQDASQDVGGRLLFGFNAWGSRIEVRIAERQER